MALRIRYGRYAVANVKNPFDASVQKGTKDASLNSYPYLSPIFKAEVWYADGPLSKGGTIEVKWYKKKSGNSVLLKTHRFKPEKGMDRFYMNSWVIVKTGQIDEPGMYYFTVKGTIGGVTYNTSIDFKIEGTLRQAPEAGHVKGQVIDFDTQLALEGVRVDIGPGTDITDDKGLYDINVGLTQALDAKFSKDGYDTNEVSLNGDANDKVILDVAMFRTIDKTPEKPTSSPKKPPEGEKEDEGFFDEAGKWITYIPVIGSVKAVLARLRGDDEEAKESTIKALIGAGIAVAALFSGGYAIGGAATTAAATGRGSLLSGAAKVGAGLAGVDTLAVWLASDNIISGIAFTARSLKDAVKSGTMTLNEANKELVSLDKWMNEAIDFVKASVSVNPALIPFKNIFLTNTEKGRFDLDRIKEDIQQAPKERADQQEKENLFKERDKLKAQRDIKFAEDKIKEENRRKADESLKREHMQVSSSLSNLVSNATFHAKRITQAVRNGVMSKGEALSELQKVIEIKNKGVDFITSKIESNKYASAFKDQILLSIEKVNMEMEIERKLIIGREVENG